MNHKEIKAKKTKSGGRTMICSSCMETEGNFKNGMCKECYEAMITDNGVTNAELDELQKEFED